MIYRVLAATAARRRSARFDLYGVIVAVYYVRNVLPLAALFYATSLVADEVEGKTLTYLLTRPLTRRRSSRGSSPPTSRPPSLALPAAVVTFFS